ncbi:MAG TPA: hypothetical protein VGF14_02125 [Alphaproteobacteria bacterium]
MDKTAATFLKYQDFIEEVLNYQPPAEPGPNDEPDHEVLKNKAKGLGL